MFWCRSVSEPINHDDVGLCVAFLKVVDFFLLDLLIKYQQYYETSNSVYLFRESKRKISNVYGIVKRVKLFLLGLFFFV